MRRFSGESIDTQRRLPRIATVLSPCCTVPSYLIAPVADDARAVTCVDPRSAVTLKSAGTTRGVVEVFGWVTAPGFLSLVVHAEITITVKTAIAASAKMTTVVSVRRLRRCGRAVERRACALRAS